MSDDEDLESGETFTVHIYTANVSGAIDTLVHTLISPDSYADDAVNLFTAPADARLARNTNYLVVFEATGNAPNDFELGLTDSKSEDSGSATAWSIEDERRYDNNLFRYIFVISVNAAAEELVEVWSATLPVKDAEDDDLGCHNGVVDSTARCSNSLTDDTFEYDNTNYSVTQLLLRSESAQRWDLILTFNTTPTDATIADLTLNVGGSPFPLSEASLTGSSFTWANSGLTWTIGTDVTVTLTTPEPVGPVVSDVDVTSEPGDDDTYAIGDTIQVTVTFDQAVTVTGAPRIQLRVGGGNQEHFRWADYTGPGSAEGALLFAYTVEAGDFDDDGIYIAADELELNGGTIQSSDGTDAILDSPLQGGQSGHNVDGVRPTPQFAVTSVDGNSVIIVFSEPLSEITAPANAFTLSVVTGTAPAVSTATASGDMVTLGLASALTGDQVVTVTYTDATLGNDAVAVQDAAGNDADTFTQTVTNAVGTGCSVVDGCYAVSADWGLIPSGLGAGTEFRLIFISSGTRNASSSDIADYNTFVQTAAAAGHADIQQYSSTFRVVGSTADVDARDNTDTTYTADDKGVAIYWLGGNKVVDEYEDFYDGDWDDEANAKDESGSDRSTTGTADRPFTGSEHDGTEKLFGAISRGLGASDVMLGIPNSGTSGHGPLSSNTSWVNSNTRPFYGLSPVFRFTPTISSVEITSDPNDDGRDGDDDTYAIDDAIEATATFGEAVTVTGTPQIELQVGGETRTADYASGSGSTDLVFSYTVVEGDLDADGVAVEKGLIDLNGGTILVGTTAAGLSHGAVSASTEHKVDGVRPIFVSAETNEDGTRLFVTFSEPISSFDQTLG